MLLNTVGTVNTYFHLSVAAPLRLGKVKYNINKDHLIIDILLFTYARSFIKTTIIAPTIPYIVSNPNKF